MSLICPPRPIPSIITELTGISQVMVQGKKEFRCVIVKFFKFINNCIHFIEESTGCHVHHVVFVGHNGFCFDFPFLMEEMKRNDLLYLIQDSQIGYGLDTLIVSKIAVRFQNLSLPSSYKLCDLYEYVTGSSIGAGAHRALANVKATCAVLRHPPFWKI